MDALYSGTPLNSSDNYLLPRKCTEYNGKRIGDILYKILDDCYILMDDTILDKLYLHLTDYSEKEDFINDLLVPWFNTTFEVWDNLKKNIKTFILKMAGSTTSSQSGLKLMISTKLLLEFSEIGLINVGNDVTITLATVEMLFEAVKSVEGCVWFLNSGLWESVLKVHNSSQSIYLTRKTREFIIKLILVLQKFKVELCWPVIESLLLPLNVTKSYEPLSRQELLMAAQNFVTGPSSCCGGDEDLTSKRKGIQMGVTHQLNKIVNVDEKIVPIIQLLSCLLDALLEENCSAHDINIIFKNYNLYLWSWETLSASDHNSKLIDYLASLILYIIFSTLPRGEEVDVVAEGDIIDTLKSFLCLIQSLTSKWKYLVVNNICVLSQKLSSKLIPTPVYLCREDGITYNLRAQILFLHALPIFIFLKLARITHTDMADKFADKLFTWTSILVKRVCYQYRDTIRVCPQCCDIGELLRSSVQTLTGILKYLNKDQVVVVFQSLMHLLREFVPEEHMYLTKVAALEPFELVQKYPCLLMDVLNGIEITIKNYNITWSESLETSCVLVLLSSLACIADISTPLSTKILRLIHLAISNFIPPNLALLVENLKGSSLELLGPLLLKKLHDVHWEVRDSTLEVIQTLSSLSALKFPAFQNIILELNFPSVVIGMFECDEESYVRSSAIVCLQKMVNVKRLWEEALADKKLLEKMLSCLKIEPEGIVRKEAASLIMAICVNHEICPISMEDVYKQLVSSVVSDLHWEVKVAALTFWDAMIDHETANQGMIDGVFPAVTFSISSRKIVILTPFEIQKRLKTVLEVLGKCGCLQVLWTALNDTSDLEVARKSVTIICKLLNLLQQYGVVEETCGRATVLPQLDTCAFGSKSINGSVVLKRLNGHSLREEEKKIAERSPDVDDKFMFAAEVLNSIIDSKDVELLSSVYNNNTETNRDDGLVEEENGELENSKACHQFMTVNEFIEKVTSLNLESVIKARSDWLTASDNLDSLVYDMLAISVDVNDNGDDINAKDCY